MVGVSTGGVEIAKPYDRRANTSQKHRNRRLFTRIGGLVALLVLIAGCLYVAGYRLNRTASCPLGVYQLTGGTPQIGDLVLFCPPRTSAIRMARERGYIPFGTCPGGTVPLIKRLVAYAGDRVEVGDVVSVNGVSLANSVVLAVDGQGRPLPRGKSALLGEGQVWLMSDYTARSFDSRYFGAVAEDAFIGTIVPVWTWGAS